MLDKLVSQYSLRIHNKFVTFKTIGYGSRYSSGKPQYSTKDEEEQASIESSNAYKDGLIKLVSEVEIAPKQTTKAPVKNAKAPEDTTKAPGDDGLENLDIRKIVDLDGEGSDDSEGLEDLDGGDAHEPVIYDEVDKFRDAQAILTSPPYNVPKTSTELKSKEAIHAKAAELGVSFPNLI